MCKEYILCIDYSIVIHSDGKLLLSLTGQYNVDRFLNVASCNNKEQLLGVPTLNNGIGFDWANAFFQHWYTTHNALVFFSDNTTVSNAGHVKGACVLLEQHLQHNILYLPYWHYVYKIMLKYLFFEMLGSLSSPDVPTFKRI